jgi:hypothetical protein
MQKNLYDTVQAIYNHDLTDVLYQLREAVIAEAQTMDVGFESDKFFREQVIAGKLSALAALNVYDQAMKGPLIVDNIIAREDVEMGYDGQSVCCTIEHGTEIDGVHVYARLTLEATLPSEYIGVLVGLGRLRVVNSSVHCGV